MPHIRVATILGEKIKGLFQVRFPAMFYHVLWHHIKTLIAGGLPQQTMESNSVSKTQHT